MEKELDEKNKKLKETENKSKIMKLEYEQQIKSLQTKIKQVSFFIYSTFDNFYFVLIFRYIAAIIFNLGYFNIS